MPEYRVTWEIDVDSPDPVQAARDARKIMHDRDSTANVFYVAPWKRKRSVKGDTISFRGISKRRQIIDLDEVR